MSIAISINVRDTGTRVARALGVALRPERIAPVVGRSAHNTIRTHLFGKNQTSPNALGGRRTNYYAQAARATQFQIVGDSAVVSINQVGIAQRFFGGKIVPRTSKYLTIPVHPAAHGKRAREFDLELVFGPGGQPVALATKATSGSTVDGRGRIRKSAVRTGEIMFRLVKSVTQQPDPTVLPYDELIEARIDRDVGAYIDRIVERAGGSTS